MKIMAITPFSPPYFKGEIYGENPYSKREIYGESSWFKREIYGKK